MQKKQMLILTFGGILMTQVLLSGNEPKLDPTQFQVYPVSTMVKGEGLPKQLPSGAKDFTIDAPRKSGLILDAADFGMSENSPDNTEAFQKAIAEAKKRKAGELRIRKGCYRIAGELHVHEVSDLEINGGGSTFIYHQTRKESLLLQFANCRRIVLRDLTLDWDWNKEPLAVIAQVKARDLKAGSIDFHVPEFEKRPDLQKNLCIMAVDKINPETFNLDIPGESSYYSEVGERKNFHREWLPGSVFRFCDPKCAAIFAPGTWVRLRIPERLRCGILFTGNKHMTVRNVTVCTAPGGALIVNGLQQYWCLDNVKVKPPKGRCISSIADALHFCESQGYFKMLNCDFSFSADDCLNVHDRPTLSTRMDDYTLRVYKPLSDWLKIGDPIELLNDDFTETGYTGKITAIQQETPGSRYYRVRLDKMLPKAVTPRFVTYNHRYGSNNVIIRNCRLHENRARALLLCSSNITVENCHIFRTSGCGLEVTSGYFRLFNEGIGARNIVIRNNVFEDINLTGRDPSLDGFVMDNYIGVLHDNAYKGANVKGRILKSILIQNNHFINPRGLLLHASSCQNIFLIGNKIEFTRKPTQNTLKYAGSVFMRNMEGAYIYDNQFIGFKPLAPFFAFRKDCKNINIGGNSSK